MGLATRSGPAGNLSTIPEQQADTEVHRWLHEVPGHLTWSTGSRVGAKSMAFLRREWEFSQRLLFPHLFHVELPGTHSLESPPYRALRCFPCRSAVERGQRYPSISWERLWGGRAVSHSWAMHWSLLAWPLCRCHSNRCGRIGVWRCCPQDRAHHLTGQGLGTSSGWLGALVTLGPIQVPHHQTVHLFLSLFLFLL